MKKLKAFFAVVLTVVTLTHSQPTKAAVGAFVGGPVLIAGLVILGGTAVGTVVGIAKCNQEPNGDLAGACMMTPLFFGSLGAMLGLVVLDGEQGFAFEALTEDQASKLGVSETELAVYNSEIDQANALLAEVRAELSQKDEPTETDSVVAWDKVKDLVSAETFATMQKIVSQK